VSSTAFSWLFVALLGAMTIARLWLSSRQIRHIALHRNAVPVQFAQQIPLDAHQKAAAYNIERGRFGMLDLALSAIVTLSFTLLGGLQWLSNFANSWLSNWPTGQQLLLVALFIIITMLIDLPANWYRQFTIEQRHGFNRMTPKLFVADHFKGILLGAALGTPVLLAIIWIMKNTDQWWLWAWLLWTGFSLVLMVIFPTYIMPLFNQFDPLPEGPLRTRVQALLTRCQFEAGGLFVMDGSKRSAHGNAFFAGMGKGRRIVLFDTIINQLSHAEIEAVLAHELGHFKLKHVIKRLIPSFFFSLAAFWLIYYLMQQPWFFQGLGVTPDLRANNHQAVALILFMLSMPAFIFFLEPLGGILSRKHEFEADAFAAEYANAQDLINALVKLYKDNASTLTPDPLHSAFYDSHPPAAIRIGRLQLLAQAKL
jgi:STE24 endopeptidase